MGFDGAVFTPEKAPVEEFRESGYSGGAVPANSGQCRDTLATKRQVDKLIASVAQWQSNRLLTD